MALLTAASARQAFQGSLDSSADTILTEIIGSVGPAFARFCGYPAPSVGGSPTMESSSYTLYLPGSSVLVREGRLGLALGLRPVTAIASIYDDPDWDYTAATLVSSGDYTLDGEAGIVWVDPDASWSPTRRGVRVFKVACTAGYTTIPEDLEQLARIAVRYAYDFRHRAGLQSVSGPAGSTAYRDEYLLPPQVQEQLSRGYVLPAAYL